jgi:hypothetical protein
LGSLRAGKFSKILWFAQSDHIVALERIYFDVDLRKCLHILIEGAALEENTIMEKEKENT